MRKFIILCCTKRRRDNNRKKGDKEVDRFVLIGLTPCNKRNICKHTYTHIHTGICYPGSTDEDDANSIWRTKSI